MTSALFAQDPHFSLYHSSTLHLNPSMAGNAGVSRIIINFRDQWPGLQSYKTVNFSFDKHSGLLKGGLGLYIMRDYAGEAEFKIQKLDTRRGRSYYSLFNGIVETTNIGLVYAPLFRVKNRINIKPSLGIGFFQKSIEWNRLTFGDMIDPRYGFIYNTKEVPGSRRKSVLDLSSGLLVNTGKWLGGIAIFHLTQPDEGLIGASKLGRKYVLHGSYVLTFNDSSQFKIFPSFFMASQESSMIILPGIDFSVKKIQFGLGYRISDAIIVKFGFAGKYLRLGYSYDFTISKLSNKVTNGSNEISLGVFINHKHLPENFIRTQAGF